MRRTISRTWLNIAAVMLLITAFVPHPAAGGFIVDHNCVDLSAIPDDYLPLASSLRVLLRHASVGQGIAWGLDCLAGAHPTNSICSGFPPGRYNRDNWVLEARMGDWRDKVDDLVAQAASRTADFDVFMSKFCYIDALGDSHPDWEYVRSRMEQLQADYPDKTFVWWTIPLTRDGQPGTDLFNAQVRSYCVANGKILFDIADIECHEPDGTRLVNAHGDEIISQNYTKEIHAGHLNPEGRVRVASALWHLMARIAGWDPYPPSGPRQIFVDVVRGTDNNDGSTPEKASATIQRGIDAASDGDTVFVSAGLYAEDIRFRGKNIIVTSVDPARSDSQKRAAIRGTVSFRGTEDASCTLAGFHIDGSIVGFDSQIDPNGANHTHATISHCVLENVTTGCGGLILGCDGIIRNCVVAHIGYLCRRAWPVPAIVGCHGLIANCTLVDVHDGIEVLPGGTCTIVNSIIYHSAPIRVPAGATVNVSYCDIVDDGFDRIFGDGMVNWGPGNMAVEPCFARMGDETTAGDYHPMSQEGRWDPVGRRWVKDDVTSRCIDAGDPDSSWAAELWPHGKRINLGAYGGTHEASLSLSVFGIAGDFDRNGAVNMRDLLMFAAVWLSQDVLQAEDTDHDGLVALSDFAWLAGSWQTDAASPKEPFKVVLGKRASWAQGHEGYDPNLPGYHLAGDIASITLQARTENPPDRLVLTLRTSPDMAAMLENFTLAGAHVKLSGEPFNEQAGLEYFTRVDCSTEWTAMPEASVDGYFIFEIVGNEVRVTFLPKAIELLKTRCIISWIDWYR